MGTTRWNQSTRSSRKSKLADAIRYALTRWTGLTRFLDDGRIEIQYRRAFDPAAGAQLLECALCRFR